MTCDDSAGIGNNGAVSEITSRPLGTQTTFFSWFLGRGSVGTGFESVGPGFETVGPRFESVGAGFESVGIGFEYLGSEFQLDSECPVCERVLGFETQELVSESREIGGVVVVVADIGDVEFSIAILFSCWGEPVSPSCFFRTGDDHIGNRIGNSKDDPDWYELRSPIIFGWLQHLFSFLMVFFSWSSVGNYVA